MSLALYWFIPAHGDGRDVAKSATGETLTRPPRRDPDVAYLAQVARAADGLGFTGALVPFGMFCEDPWLVSAALAAQTTRLRFMLALRTGLISPPLVAQMAATLQRISGGRLLFNVVTGGDHDEQRRYGDALPHDERYARTAELLEVLERAWAGQEFDFRGEHYQVDRGRVVRPYPLRTPIFVGGSSPAAQAVAARHADVYLAWGESPAGLAELIGAARRLADGHGRVLAFGTRYHVIARDTADQAWQVAQELLDGMEPSRIREAQARFRRSESVGQRRMTALTQDAAGLAAYPNIWAGYGLVRPGAGAALVGSHDEVADRIAELHAMGIDHLILSGQPHLEEVYRFGEGVLPRLRNRGLLTELEPAR
ncbi:LLM class flavin-dependent oxidoreductase [Micromonospora sp. NPDC049891]|uniref:LLM class flavin-dependent oxidoreductase n=1 Tax=Micromonospora sp. NPDC049891 TaxID=3155655 RepID=UPI00340C7EFD